MARLDMNFTWRCRKAIYTPLVDIPALGLTKATPVSCRVWGCYQVNDGEDVNPYFVIELDSGRCTYAQPEQVQFIEPYDEEEEEESEC